MILYTYNCINDDHICEVYLVDLLVNTYIYIVMIYEVVLILISVVHAVSKYYIRVIKPP